MDPCLDVIKVDVLEHLILEVSFEDGLTGQVIFKPSHLTCVFEPLLDPVFFAKAKVDYGTVTWPGEIDLSPDAMYDEIKQNGKWILG